MMIDKTQFANLQNGAQKTSTCLKHAKEHFHKSLVGMRYQFTFHISGLMRAGIFLPLQRSFSRSRS